MARVRLEEVPRTNVLRLLLGKSTVREGSEGEREKTRKYSPDLRAGKLGEPRPGKKGALPRARIK